ncbi:MAG: hypothetical protein IPN33_13085 [Saprospiraceae bacterium]|nr:hypothetical protein [Saprospiraceae bacterium]
MKKTLFWILLAIIFYPKIILSQSCNDLSIQHEADIVSTCGLMAMTMVHDQNNLPYLYVANKEAGLTVYDISNINMPVQIASVPISSLGNLEVMNLFQHGNYLLLALGNHFANSGSAGGIAIVDVSNPATPTVADHYAVPGSSSGAGVVKAEGDYAYLGAMKSGIVIFDISNVNDIEFVSQFIPDINYPVTNPNPNFYNARGLEVNNDIVYLCYDAGGLRIINCVDKFHPAETGRFANPIMYDPFNLPRAYNNLVVDDSLLYVAVDYCGVEVLNIADTANITLQGWWNPYNCPYNNWYTSPVHANEIQYDKNGKKLFLSTGKSDMMVVDVSNPSNPDSCAMFGSVSNNIGTWGIGLWQNQLFLSYICTFGIPFASDWTGVKILTYNSPAVGVQEQVMSNAISVFPNPFYAATTIETTYELNNAMLIIYNPQGQVVKQTVISGHSNTLYRDNLPGRNILHADYAGGKIFATEK